MGFDVDSCSCGFDGKQVYMTPRCHQALVRQINTVDMTRRSPTYELRLAKYADRGFEVEVPTLNRDAVDPMIFEKPWDEVRGLSKLLLLEKLRTPEARYAYRERSTKDHSLESYKIRQMMNDPYLKKRMEYSNEKASDYSTVFLPWGPNWTAKKIRKLMMTKDIVLNSSWSTLCDRDYHTHPCFVGTLEEVLKDCCGDCPEVPADVNREELECFVSGPLSFIVDDPGRQSIGSFHPITEGDWSDGAYLSQDSVTLVKAANEGDLDMIREIVSNGVPIDITDFLGRTSLHIATLSNQLKAVELLLDSGADPTLHMKDGRSIVHIAAEYGYIEILRLLLEKLKLGKKDSKEGEQIACEMDLDEVNKTTQFTALHYAVLFGHVECAELLLQNGASCSGMIWSADKSTGVAPLILAAHCECFSKEVAIQMFTLLVKYGASLRLMDKQFNNGMHQLCQYNYSHLITYLLENDPQALSLCSEVNVDCQTPLHIAINNKFYTLAKVLINKGVPLYPNEESVNRLNKCLRIESHSRPYGRRSITLNPMSLLLNVYNGGITTEGGVEFFKFLLEKGDDVNTIVNRQTVLDAILNSQSYLSEEEYSRHIRVKMTSQQSVLELYKKELETVKQDSYQATVLQRLIEKEKKNIENMEKNFKRELMLWKDRKEYDEQLYKLVDARGGKLFLELYKTEKESVEKQIMGSNKQKNGMMINRFYSQQNDELDSVECVTVVDGKVLQGEKRLEALREKTAKNDQMSIERRQLKNTQNQAVQGYDQFTIFAKRSDYGWGNDAIVNNEEASLYMGLFNAVWENNLEEVKRLCTPDKEKKCLLLACSGYEGMTPLSIAVNKGYREMIDLIFNLLNEQYTPLPVVREKHSDKVSNYALVTGDYEEKQSFVDPNADFSVVINTTEPDILFIQAAQFDMSQNPPYSTLDCLAPVSRNIFYYRRNDDDDDDDDEEEEKNNSILQSCNLLEYLIYRGDCSLLSFVLEHLKVLSEQVFEKQLKANIKKEDERSSMIITSIISGDYQRHSYYSPVTSVNVMIPCIVNDNMEMLRVLNQYTFLGLNILREDDVKEEKVVKRRLNNNYQNDYDDEWDSEDYSDSDSEEEKRDDEMEIEGDKEMDEEGEGEEDDSVESEYADSDEEEMKRLKAFKQDGRSEQTGRLSNPLHPILLALRYNASSCLRYLLDLKRVKEDVTQYKEKYCYKSEKIDEAGGIDEVTERVFSLKYELKDIRLYLDAAASTDDVDVFNSLVKEIVKDQGDMKKLVRRSKKYSSLFEFCCQYKYFNIATYLIKNYSFREKEVLAAYSHMANVLNGITLDVIPRKKNKPRYYYGNKTKKPAAMKQVELYKNIMSLIMLIPAEYKDKVLSEVLAITIQSHHAVLSNEIIQSTKLTITDFADLFGNVDDLHPTTFNLLVECMGLKKKLMKEDPRGYTIVEVLMKKYLTSAASNQGVRYMKNDVMEEEEAKEQKKLEEVEAENEEGKEKVHVFKMLKRYEMNTGALLKMAFNASTGLKRELTSMDDVQKRVKKETKDAAQSAGFVRRGVRSNGKVNIPTNPRVNKMCQLENAEKKNC